MFYQLKSSLRISRVLPVLIISLLVFSCKNKKKAMDIADTKQVKEEITNEIAAYEDDKSVDLPSSKESEVASKSTQINKYLTAISSASSLPEANNNINEALTLFSSPEAVVLIEIYEEGEDVDYDEPTTINKYLNYLKDTKSQPAKVQDVVYDTKGKIKELVLRK